MRGSKQDLRRAVPQSDDLVRVALERHGEGSPEAKIGDLQDPSLLVQQQILRLEIAVEHAVGVAVRHALAELVEEVPDQVGRHRAGIRALAVRVDELLEVGVEELEDEVEHGLGGLGGVFAGVGVLDGEESDDVERLREHLEERDLTEGRRRDSFLVHLEPSLLQSDQLACGLVLGLVDLAVRALADLL